MRSPARRQAGSRPAPLTQDDKGWGNAHSENDTTLSFRAQSRNLGQLLGLFKNTLAQKGVFKLLTSY